MQLVLNEDQRMLQDAARNFCRDHAPVDVLRETRDSRDPTGYPAALWQQMVNLGWAGMAIPEEHDGFGFGYGGLGIVLEETGRTLVPSPLVASVLLGATAVNLAGSEAQKKSILPQVVSGQMTLALALEETPFHRPSHIACRAQRDGEGFRISGRKQFVLDGHCADQLIVVARTTGESGDESGITLFVVDGNAEGLKRMRTSMVDSRNAAIIELEDVRVDQDAVLGDVDGGHAVLERVLDIGRIGLAAEMLGGIQEVFDRTVAYLKERKQFGVPIGSFQALQHRAAILYSEIELCRSLVRKALAELDGEQRGIPVLASAAKAKLGEVFTLVSNEGVQMHGGIGMTDEFDIGFYLKRARVAGQCLGDTAFHRDRYARLNGY
ncbi:MAG: acyl-CoA dehydrogenase family protein [Pseudohongiellaceae bacterium]